MKKNSNKDYAVALYESAKDLKGKDLESVIGQFVKLLFSKHKLKQSGQIISEFIKHAKRQEGIIDIEITSAHELEKNVFEKISAVFGKKVNATQKINKNILGGMVITTEDKIFDASLKTQLIKLKQALS